MLVEQCGGNPPPPKYALSFTTFCSKTKFKNENKNTGGLRQPDNTYNEKKNQPSNKPTNQPTKPKPKQYHQTNTKKGKEKKPKVINLLEKEGILTP